MKVKFNYFCLIALFLLSKMLLNNLRIFLDCGAENWQPALCLYSVLPLRRSLIVLMNAQEEF